MSATKVSVELPADEDLRVALAAAAARTCPGDPHAGTFLGLIARRLAERLDDGDADRRKAAWDALRLLGIESVESPTA
jgi:HEAT repeat protein